MWQLESWRQQTKGSIALKTNKWKLYKPQRKSKEMGKGEVRSLHGSSSTLHTQNSHIKHETRKWGRNKTKQTKLLKSLLVMSTFCKSQISGPRNLVNPGGILYFVYQDKLAKQEINSGFPRRLETTDRHYIHSCSPETQYQDLTQQ